MSKRHSILPPTGTTSSSSSHATAPPKPPVHFSSSATIADSAQLSGTHLISVQAESVIHPRARLDSLVGRITVGRRCVVQERALLGAGANTGGGAGGGGRISAVSGAGVGSSSGGGGEGGETAAAVTLADYVTVEVGAVVEAGDGRRETVIGEGTVVGVGARVGAGAAVGKHCTLTPHTEIAAGEFLPDFTIVYSNGLRRTDKRGVAELRNKAQARQIDVLRRMIPSNPAKFA